MADTDPTSTPSPDEPDQARLTSALSGSTGDAVKLDPIEPTLRAKEITQPSAKPTVGDPTASSTRSSLGGSMPVSDAFTVGDDGTTPVLDDDARASAVPLMNGVLSQPPTPTTPPPSPTAPAVETPFHLDDEALATIRPMIDGVAPKQGAIATTSAAREPTSLPSLQPSQAVSGLRVAEPAPDRTFSFRPSGFDILAFPRTSSRFNGATATHALTRRGGLLFSPEPMATPVHDGDDSRPRRSVTAEFSGDGTVHLQPELPGGTHLCPCTITLQVRISLSIAWGVGNRFEDEAAVRTALYNRHLAPFETTTTQGPLPCDEPFAWLPGALPMAIDAFIDESRRHRLRLTSVAMLSEVTILVRDTDCRLYRGQMCAEREYSISDASPVVTDRTGADCSSLGTVYRGLVATELERVPTVPDTGTVWPEFETGLGSDDRGQYWIRFGLPDAVVMDRNCPCRYRAALGATDLYIAWDDGEPADDPCAHFIQQQLQASERGKPFAEMAEGILLAMAMSNLRNQRTDDGWRDCETASVSAALPVLDDEAINRASEQFYKMLDDVCGRQFIADFALGIRARYTVELKCAHPALIEVVLDFAIRPGAARAIYADPVPADEAAALPEDDAELMQEISGFLPVIDLGVGELKKQAREGDLNPADLEALDDIPGNTCELSCLLADLWEDSEFKAFVDDVNRIRSGRATVGEIRAFLIRAVRLIASVATGGRSEAVADPAATAAAAQNAANNLNFAWAMIVRGGPDPAIVGRVTAIAAVVVLLAFMRSGRGGTSSPCPRSYRRSCDTAYRKCLNWRLDFAPPRYDSVTGERLGKSQANSDQSKPADVLDPQRVCGLCKSACKRSRRRGRGGWPSQVRVSLNTAEPGQLLRDAGDPTMHYAWPACCPKRFALGDE